MEKIYLVELNIFKENAFHGLQKIPLDNYFSPKLLYLKCHREWCMHAKNQDRSPSKLSRWKQMFLADFISGSRDFTQH